MTITFETTNVEEAYDKLGSLYNVRRFTSPGEHPFVRIEIDKLGPAELHHLTFTMDCDVDCDPLGALYLGHVIDGTVTYNQDGENRAYGIGDVFLAVQPHLPFRADIGNADVEFAALDVPLLAQVADAAPGRSAQPIRFTAFRPATQHDAWMWLNTYRFVRDHLRGPPAIAQPLLTGAAVRLLAATALSTFPNTGLYDPTIEDRRDAHTATLRRAISFIDDNAHRDISVADIAAAAHITIRALQLAFRRHLDCTPTAYLRRVRLEYARQDLITGDPDDITVTQVAARWGFWNPGRFAAHYRAAYGCSPATTLRSRRVAHDR